MCLQMDFTVHLKTKMPLNLFYGRRSDVAATGITSLAIARHRADSILVESTNIMTA